MYQMRKAHTLMMVDESSKNSKIKARSESTKKVFVSPINTSPEAQSAPPFTNKKIEDNTELLINMKTFDTDKYESNEEFKFSKKFNFRKDFKGNAISKGKNKKHHITFKDCTGTFIKLVEYVNIQKIVDDSSNDSSTVYRRNSDEESSTSCSCVIY